MPASAVEELYRIVGKLENRIDAAFGTVETLAALDVRVTDIENEVVKPFSASRIDSLETDLAAAEAIINANLPLAFTYEAGTNVSCTEDGNWHTVDESGVLSKDHPRILLIKTAFTSNNLSSQFYARAYGATDYQWTEGCKVVNVYHHQTFCLGCGDDKKYDYKAYNAGTMTSTIQIVGYWYIPDDS